MIVANDFPEYSANGNAGKILEINPFTQADAVDFEFIHRVFR